MLGAQARAAELQAAKSAAMRQRAHRQAEDLPPESAQVSLTDFARNPLPNKNKGVKAFRPLNEADFESPNNQLEAQSPVTATPSAERNQMRFSEAVPIAPRAMLRNADSKLSKLTPSRLQASILTPQDKLCDVPAKIPETLNGPFTTSPYYDIPMATYGYVYGPGDLSPIKQEIKFAEMKRRHELLSSPEMLACQNVTPFLPDARTISMQQNYQHENSHNHSELYQASFDVYAPTHPQIQNYLAETGTSATGYGQCQSHTDRIQVFADDLMDHHHQLQQQTQFSDPVKSSLSLMKKEKPYDRHSKMQSFVAAQQAMAKKRKTVLHNPDLYRSAQQIDTTILQRRDPATITPSTWQVHQRVSMQEDDESVEDYVRDRFGTLHQQGPFSQAVLKGRVSDEPLEGHATVTKNGDDENPRESCSEGVSEHLPNQIVPEEWYTLRMPTVVQREQMLRNMRRLAINFAPVPEPQLISSSTSVTGVHAQHWLRNESSHDPVYREKAIEVVHGFTQHATKASTYGIIGRPVSKEISDLSTRGALKAVVTVLATLHDNSENARKISGLGNYTPAPKFSIDKESALNVSGASLFDELVLTSPIGEVSTADRQT